jgi:hypothetical protein
MSTLEQETIAEGEPWCVLIGQLSPSRRVEVLRQGQIFPYPLERREPFERFSRPQSLDSANRYLADNPWGGCRSVVEIVAAQPGLLAVFTGDFERDANMLEGRCVVSDVEIPGYQNWGMVSVPCRDKAGHECRAFESTVQLLSRNPRCTTSSISDLEGTTYISEAGDQEAHSPQDYERDLLYDLRELLGSQIAYLDKAKPTTDASGSRRWA